MNIHKARELQKDLFKRSECKYKRMRVVSVCENGSKIAYTVLHHVSDDRSIGIDSELVKRIKQDIECDVHVSVHYISVTEKLDKKFVDPSGFYIQEFIEID